VSREVPTLIVHPAEIDWRKLNHWYTWGQELCIAQSRNVPPQCWSPSIKTRARLQYYLADQAARRAAGEFSGAVLLDLQGNVTETSAANLILVEGHKLISPPLDSILYGISLQRTLRLGSQAGWQVNFEAISPARAEQADEILLCGSTGCLWPAARIGGRVFEASPRGSAFQALAGLWRQDVQLDFIQQARIVAGHSVAGS
jgi:branched-subunit amino acid aminotransferase/4-amino-4-deoxychorismate lyase